MMFVDLSVVTKLNSCVKHTERIILNRFFIRNLDYWSFFVTERTSYIQNKKFFVTLMK